MTDQEAAAILGILTAAYPNQDVSRETAQLWMGMLAEIDAGDAQAAARDAVRQDNWFPSIARFLALAGAAKHARRNREAAHRGLPSPGRAAPDESRFKALVSGCRDQLASRGDRGHNHKGPKPCPVCGGLPRPKLPATSTNARRAR